MFPVCHCMLNRDPPATPVCVVLPRRQAQGIEITLRSYTRHDTLVGPALALWNQSTLIAGEMDETTKPPCGIEMGDTYLALYISRR